MKESSPKLQASEASELKVFMKTGTSNGNSANQENVKVDVEVESKDLPPMPPGFHFVQSSAVLILEYLVKKIVGVPLASDLVKVRDGVQVLDPEEHRFGEFSLLIYHL